jgi:hypothetical protein
MNIIGRPANKADLEPDCKAGVMSKRKIRINFHDSKFFLLTSMDISSKQRT